MRREWECAPPVIHKSSEHATGYFMGILWANEWHKRRKGIACKPMDALIEDAVVRAHAAMAEQQRAGQAVLEESMRQVANSGSDECTEACDGEIPGDMGDELPALEADTEIPDWIVQNIGRGEGEGG